MGNRRMGLLPGYYSFKIWKGATLSKQISLRDRTGAPIDLTGFDIEFRMPNLVLTRGDGLLVDDAEGAITLVLTSDQTRAITWKRANYSVVITSDEEYVVLTGQIFAIGT